jgi:DNA replication protein DnaC
MWQISDIESRLTELGLTEVAQLIAMRHDEAVKKQSTYLEFVGQLLEEEITVRKERSFQTRLRLAKLPYHKTLADFDFSFQPSINERQIRELLTLNFIREAANLVLLGPPGVGKTHLAVSLASEALTQGMSVYFTTAQDMIDELRQGQLTGQVDKKLRRYIKPKLLIVDEMGYLTLDKVGATVLFQLISKRYEKGSIILTSNKSFVDWGNVLGDQSLPPLSWIGCNIIRFP